MERSAARTRTLVVAALMRHPADGHLPEAARRILVSQRRSDQSLPLHWEFPGGKVEPGEAPEAALAREIREELGCEVMVRRIFEVVFFAYPAFDLYMLVYTCELATGTPRAVEVADVQWVWPETLPALTLPPADVPLARALAAAAGTAT